ncbi:MAG: hypothetical protein LBK94_04905, partial [Prevotellaceae bacterium]|nr:hypothetical protein [Prevotellaceae bacterium]
MKKLQDFNQYGHKALQIKSYFLFFCLDAKEAKNQGERCLRRARKLGSRRLANGSTANGINVSLRLTEFRFNALCAERVPRLRSLCR